MGLFANLGLFVNKIFGPQHSPLTDACAPPQPAVSKHPRLAVEEPPRLAVHEPQYFHWPGNGIFRVSAVGESFYRNQIESLAQNGLQPALVFCTAHLVPETNNILDPMAVALHVNDLKVAHLSREDAKKFRDTLRDHGLAGQITSCNAVISSGGTTSDRTYDYSIDLDLQAKGLASPLFPELVRLSSAPKLIKYSTEELIVEFPFVKHDVLDMCSLGCKLKVWTKPDREDIQFFAPSSIGENGRIGVLQKNFYGGFEADLARFSCTTVFGFKGPSVLVRLGTSIDPRFAFRLAERAKMLIFCTDKMGNYAVLAANFNPLKPVSGQLEESLEVSMTVPNPDHLVKLRELVTSADFIVGHDVDAQKLQLAQLLPESTGKVWISTKRTWFEFGTPPEQIASIMDETCNLNALEKCSSLFEFLFTPSGKTTKTRRYMVWLLSSNWS